MLTGQATRRANVPALDIVRGGSALYVAVYHTVGVLTESGRHFNGRGGSFRLITAGNPLGFVGFGFYAVLVFFVLSGFVIHLRQATHPQERKRLGGGRWVAGYAWRRLMRIYPPLVGAILATALLWMLGRRAFPDLYGQVLDHPTARHLVDQAGTARAAFLTLVPYKGPAGFGADAALWSISYELWFYLAYVPVLLVLRDRLKLTPGALLLGSVLVAAAIYYAVVVRETAAVPLDWRAATYIPMYFPAWMAGAYLAELYARGVRARAPAVLVVTGVAAIVLAARISDNNTRPHIDLFWVLGIALILAALVLKGDRARERAQVPPPAVTAWAASTARWSYSLYLIHVPVIVFAYGVLHDGTGPMSNPLAVGAVLLACIAGGLILYGLVERPSIHAANHPPEALRQAGGGPRPGSAARRVAAAHPR